MNWKTIRRETSLVEHVCEEHGCGHPNYYSVARLHEMTCAKWVPDSEDDMTEWHPEYDHGFAECSWWVHGCCGCCASVDFPGRHMRDKDIIRRLYGKIDDYVDDYIDEGELHDWCAYTIHDLNVNEKLRVK